MSVQGAITDRKTRLGEGGAGVEAWFYGLGVMVQGLGCEGLRSARGSVSLRARNRSSHGVKSLVEA